MKNIISKCAVVAVLFMLNGCSSVLNPFQSEFQCPKTANGKCISIKGAYAEDVASSTDGNFLPEETLPATETRRPSNSREDERPVVVVPPKPCCDGKPGTGPGPDGAPRQVSVGCSDCEVANSESGDNEDERLGQPRVVRTKKKDIPLQDYRTASLKKVTKLLRDPVTPLVAPPLVMRVLILPYEDDDGTLNMQRFKFLMVDRPKWVLGDYLSKEEGE